MLLPCFYRVFVSDLADTRQLQPLADAAEQQCAEILLQLGNFARESRLGQIQMADALFMLDCSTTTANTFSSSSMCIFLYLSIVHMQNCYNF